MHLMITYPAWSEGHVVCDRGSRPSRIRNHEDMHLLPVPNCDRVTTKREKERQKKCTHTFFQVSFQGDPTETFFIFSRRDFFSFLSFSHPREFSERFFLAFLSFSHPREFARPLSEVCSSFNPELRLVQ